MDRIIIDAINNQLTLSFFYDGEHRTVEPHCYGNDTKGHDALRAYQINKGWRLFHVDEMGPVQTGAAFSGPRPKYKRNDSVMDRVYAQL